MDEATVLNSALSEKLDNNIAKISLAAVQDIASGESLQNFIAKRYAKRIIFKDKLIETFIYRKIVAKLWW